MENEKFIQIKTNTLWQWTCIEFGYRIYKNYGKIYSKFYEALEVIDQSYVGHNYSLLCFCAEKYILSWVHVFSNVSEAVAVIMMKGTSHKQDFFLLYWSFIPSPKNPHETRLSYITVRQSGNGLQDHTAATTSQKVKHQTQIYW